MNRKTLRVYLSFVYAFCWIAMVDTDTSSIPLSSSDVNLQCDYSLDLLVIEQISCQIPKKPSGDGPGDDDSTLDDQDPMLVPHSVYVTFTRNCFRQCACAVRMRDVSAVFDVCGEQNLVVQYSCVQSSQLVNVCDEHASITKGQDTLYVTSPRYPDSYPGNRRCTLHITSTDEEKIQILDLEIETKRASVQCADYMAMEDKAGATVVRRYEVCGLDFGNVTTPKMFTTTSLGVEFVTDSVGQFRGFLLKITSSSPAPCERSACLNGGNCMSPSDASQDYLCECPAQYSGVNCEAHMDSPCYSGPCFNLGVCEATADSFWCRCPSGFGGQYCQNTILVTTLPRDVTTSDGDVDGTLMFRPNSSGTAAGHTLLLLCANMWLLFGWTM